MRNRLLGVIGVAVIVIAVGGILKMMRMPVMGQTPTAKGTGGAVASAGPAPRTAWGEPDLQGIWTDPYQTPLQRPARFRDKEYLTDEERAALDKQRTEIMRKD